MSILFGCVCVGLTVMCVTEEEDERRGKKKKKNIVIG